MTKISRSSERFSFHRETYMQRQQELGKTEKDQEVADYLDMLDSYEISKRKDELDLNWQQNNLEYDLRTTDWILEKVRESDCYAQNLYAALCNNDFEKIEIQDTKENIVKILKDGLPVWHCSWRYAGGIIADMRQLGDYIDWYCSGIKEITDSVETDEKKCYVGEGDVTDEIKQDLYSLGWRVIPEE